jgi:DNA replication and repair protein RecF
VALSLKLAEVEWLHRETGEMPMLLLDDMISELDPDRRRYLIHTLESAQQVLTTTTEVQGLPRSFLIQATTLKVENGQIKPLPPSEIPGRTGA